MKIWKQPFYDFYKVRTTLFTYSSIVAKGWLWVASKSGYKECGVSTVDTSVSCNYKVKEFEAKSFNLLNRTFLNFHAFFSLFHNFTEL